MRAERALLLVCLGCSGSSPQETSADTSPSDTQISEELEDSAVEVRWSGAVQAEVVDVDGQPVEGAWVMLGGSPADSWALSDATGKAQVMVVDDGLSDRYLLAGAVGWRSGGVDLDDHTAPTETLRITLKPLPEADNPDYHFQSGGDGDSPDTTECGHCHRTIADGWSTSRHRGAGKSTYTWDLFVGAASTATDCASVGWEAEGQVRGEVGSVEQRCSVSTGVLPFLHDDCGQPDQPACDHPDQRPLLERFGSCGDCHSPAIDGAVPGAVDLTGASGIAFDEGVTCDLCHKTASVTPGGAPGLDGAISLLRPGEDTTVAGQEFDPVTFGPYPDVIIPLMRGSYAPQFREAGWCSSCHEHEQPALHPDQSLDEARWPDGLPIQQTWSEYEAAEIASTGASCQTCHMPVLYEESSTYNITENDLVPALDQGWLRRDGEVRQHTFSADLTAPTLTLDLVPVADTVYATAIIHNAFAGHAVPTGEPMRQLVLLVEAVDGAGEAVVPQVGVAVPDVGGYQASAEMGADLTVQDSVLTFAGQTLSEGSMVRFVRPTGSWLDYAGPGAGIFSQASLSAEEKGLPLYEALGERAVASTDGAQVVLAEPPPTLQVGDLAYLVEDHHLAGSPGWLFSKILVDAEGARGVPHYRAVDVASDNRIAPGASAATTHVFALPADGVLSVTARLVRRRYAAPVADEHGWDPGDIAVREETAITGEGE